MLLLLLLRVQLLLLLQHHGQGAGVLEAVVRGRITAGGADQQGSAGARLESFDLGDVVSVEAVHELVGRHTVGAQIALAVEALGHRIAALALAGGAPWRRTNSR